MLVPKMNYTISYSLHLPTNDILLLCIQIIDLSLKSLFHKFVEFQIESQFFSKYNDKLIKKVYKQKYRRNVDRNTYRCYVNSGVRRIYFSRGRNFCQGGQKKKNQRGQTRALRERIFFLAPSFFLLPLWQNSILPPWQNSILPMGQNRQEGEQKTLL